MMFLNMSMMMHEAAMQARNSKEQRLSIENLQLIPHDLYTIAEEENAIDIDDNDVPYSDNNNDDDKNEEGQKTRITSTADTFCDTSNRQRSDDINDPESQYYIPSSMDPITSFMEDSFVEGSFIK